MASFRIAGEAEDASISVVLAGIAVCARQRVLPDGIARRLVRACRKSPRVSPRLSGSGALHASSDGLIWPKDGCASTAYDAMAAAGYFPPPQAALHREAK